MTLDDFSRCLKNLMVNSAIVEQKMVKDRIVMDLGNEPKKILTLSLGFFRLRSKFAKDLKSYGSSVSPLMPCK